MKPNRDEHGVAFTRPDCVVLMYNCDSKKSFEDGASYWPTFINKFAANKVLLGMENSKSERNEAEAKEFCEKHGFAGPFFANKDDKESCTQSFHDILTYVADNYAR